MNIWLRVWGLGLSIIGALVLGKVGQDFWQALPSCPAAGQPCRSVLFDGLSKPVLALELARTKQQVTAVQQYYQNLRQDWQAEMKVSLTQDASLVIPVYGFILLGFGLLLLRRHRKLAGWVLACAVVAMLGDYWENYGIRQALRAWETSAPSEAAAQSLLRWVWGPSWCKWLAFYAGFCGAAGLFFSAKSWPRGRPIGARVLAGLSVVGLGLGGLLGVVGALTFWLGYAQPLEGGVLLILLGWVSSGLLLLFAPDWLRGGAPPEQDEKLPVPLFRVLWEEYEQRQSNAPPLASAKEYEQLEQAYAQAKDAQERVFLCAKMQRVNDRLVKELYDLLHAEAKHGPRRAALCFSGGGVRSATYALGLLQGLVKQGVSLGGFHYLSTVSGGGYTGSWLTAWLHRAGLKGVEKALKAEAPLDPLQPEPAPLRHLRQYSNPLTPNLGVFSADTWTLVGIYLRNLSLNWLVLLPLLMVFLAVPRLAMAFACWNKPNEGLLDALPVTGLLLGWLSVAYFIANRPSLARRRRPLFQRFEWRRDEPEFLWFGLLPLLLEAALLAAYWAWAATRYDSGAEVVLRTRWWWLLLSGCGAMAFARLVWRGNNLGKRWRESKASLALAGVVSLGGLLGGLADWPGSWRFSLTAGWIFILFACAKYGGGLFLSWLWTGCLDRREAPLALVLVGLLGGLALWGVAQLYPQPVSIKALQVEANPAPTAPPPVKQALKLADEPVRLVLEGGAPGQPATLKLETPVRTETPPTLEAVSVEQQLSVVKQTGWYVVFGLPLVLFAFLAAATVFVGLASGITTDADREWMGRAGAWMLLAGGLWIVISTTVLFGAEWIWRANAYLASAVLTAGTGLTTLILGWLPKTAATTQGQGEAQSGRLLKLGLPLVAFVFALALFAWLSVATDLFLRGLAQADAVHWLYGNFLPVAQPPQSLLAAVLQPSSYVQWHWVILHELPGLFVAAAVLCLLLVGGGAGVFINVNKFSLHAANRDRLIRAYLGASNAWRSANPFTGFDEHDDLQLHEVPEPLFTAKSFKDFAGFVDWLNQSRTAGGDDPVARFLWDAFTPATRQRLERAHAQMQVLWGGSVQLWEKGQKELRRQCVGELNRLMHGELLLPVESAEQKSWLAKLVYQPSSAESAFDQYRHVIATELGQQPKVSACPNTPRPIRAALAKPIAVKKLRLNRLLLEEACKKYLSPCGPVEPRPFHVVNMALNLASGKELAWQERKARSFFASPLHAGSPGVGLRPAEEYAITFDGKGALTLGTALAISGAAANPNAGYHSSPLITFFLTLFNVRMGWWLGNPGSAGQRTYRTSSPFFAPNVLLAETFGQTDDTHPYVNVSDGGHFDNLGIYEMVRRRCHFILVSDGGQDEKYTYDDLGTAIRLIYADLGVPICFKTPLPSGSHAASAAKRTAANQEYCAIAEIDYQKVDGKDAVNGVLVLVKPTVYGTEPADIYNYALSNPTFPNDPTFTDQFFSESQFESYRHLGDYTIEHLVEKLKIGNAATVEELERQARFCGRMTS